MKFTDYAVPAVLTRHDRERIENAGQQITDLQEKELRENPAVIDMLNNSRNRLYIGGTDVHENLVAVYMLASENILSDPVLHFLCSLDDTEILQELSGGIFLTLAAAQKKKTDFKVFMSREIKKRHAQEKKAEMERRRQEYEVFLSQQPEYYGKPLSQTVVEQILAQEGVIVRLNSLTKKLEYIGHGAEKLYLLYSRENIAEVFPTIVKDICTDKKVKDATTGAIVDYLFNIADSNRYHPVQEMLKANRNDDASHLETIFEILRLTDDFDKTLVRKWLIQTVAFAFASVEKPVSAEGVLVLQGEQGIAKTSFFRILAGNPRWFAEGAVIDMRNKDSIINAVSTWICELGEVDSTLKKEQSALKAFITRTIDSIRMPYSRTFTDMPRTTSFCGTVNPEQFLKDATGNRRYWTIHVDSIDRNKLFSMTQTEIFDIWGYVYSLYLENPQGFRLNDVETKRLEKHNRDHSTDLPIEDEVKSLLDYGLANERWQWVSPADLSVLVSGARAEHIGRVLSRLHKEIPGVEKRRTKSGYQYLLPLSGWTASTIRTNPALNNCAV